VRQDEVPVKIHNAKKLSLPAKKLEGLILLEPLRGFEPPTRALRMRISAKNPHRHMAQNALK